MRIWIFHLHSIVSSENLCVVYIMLSLHVKLCTKSIMLPKFIVDDHINHWISLAVSLGFFDDIYVPVPFLFSPNRNEPVPGHKWASLLSLNLIEIELVPRFFHQVLLYHFFFCIRNWVNWIWNYEGGDYSVDAEDEVILLAIRFFALTIVQPCMQPHNFLAWLQIRFKVHDVSYPPIPLEPKDVKPFAPMVVTVSHRLKSLSLYQFCHFILMVVDHFK